MKQVEPRYITTAMSPTDSPHHYEMTLVSHFVDVEFVTLTPMEFYSKCGYDSLMGVPCWGVRLFLNNKEFHDQICQEGKLDELQNWVNQEEKNYSTPLAEPEPPSHFEKVIVGQRCLKTMPCQHKLSFFDKGEKFKFSASSFYEKYGLEGLKKLPEETLSHWYNDLEKLLRKNNELEAIENLISDVALPGPSV